MLTEYEKKCLKVCAVVGVLEPDTNTLEGLMLVGKILDVCDRERCNQVHELQQQKLAEGDAEFYLWDIPLEDFLAEKSAEYLAEVRRKIGR